MSVGPDAARALDRLLDELLDLDDAARAERLREISEPQRSEIAALLDAALADDGFLRPGGALSPTLVDFAFAGDDPGILRPGDSLGTYRIVEEIGVGGMGRVYLGERADGMFTRQVAIKLLAMATSPASLERLQHEQRILADLVHPNIAQLYDAGVASDGSPYLVMEHVAGEAIDQWCQRRGADVRARLHLVIDVCAAVHAAHQRLIVHRDIKPSNILVDGTGQVKLLDFGIARMLESDEQLAGPAPASAAVAGAMQTQGRIWLTPRYASPEQLAGQPTSTASDVYQLGLLLWQLLTGRAPPAGGSGSGAEATALTAASRSTAVPLQGLPAADLDAVVAKALAREPAARYASADRLSEDLQHLIEGRPVAAVPATRSYRARRFAGRHRGAVAVGVVVAAAILAGLVGTLWQAGEARMHAQRAEAQARRAETVRDFLAEVLSSARPSRGEIPNAIDIVDAGSRRARAELMQSDPRVAGDVLTVTGKARYRLSDFDGAYADLQDAIAAFEPIDPAPAEQLALLHSDMGRVLRVRGPGGDAGEHHRKAIHWAQVAGLPPELQWGLQASLGAWMMEYDDTEQAERMLLDLLAVVDEDRVNGDHLLTALNALTTAMALLGRDTGEQIPWHERRLAVAIRVHGPEDGWTAYTLADAIPTFRNAGLPERALEIGAQALAIVDRLYSEPDALAVVVYCNNASMFRHLGRHREALVLYERYAAMERELKRANLHAESCWAGYAESLAAQDRVDEALAAIAQAHAVLDRTGSDRPLNRLNLCGLEAGLVARIQDPAQASRRLQRCGREYAGDDFDSTRAVQYRTVEALLAVSEGRHERATELLHTLREQVLPTLGSTLWLNVWLPSIWIERAQGRVELAAQLAIRITGALDEIRVDWNGRDVVRRCLSPQAAPADCLLLR